MTVEQRTRMMGRCIARRKVLVQDCSSYRLWSGIFFMLGYGGSVRRINAWARKYKLEHGL